MSGPARETILINDDEALPATIDFSSALPGDEVITGNPTINFTNIDGDGVLSKGQVNTIDEGKAVSCVITAPPKADTLWELECKVRTSGSLNLTAYIWVQGTNQD